MKCRENLETTKTLKRKLPYGLRTVITTATISWRGFFPEASWTSQQHCAVYFHPWAPHYLIFSCSLICLCKLWQWGFCLSYLMVLLLCLWWPGIYLVLNKYLPSLINELIYIFKHIFFSLKHLKILKRTNVIIRFTSGFLSDVVSARRSWTVLPISLFFMTEDNEDLFLTFSICPISSAHRGHSGALTDGSFIFAHTFYKPGAGEGPR